MVVAPLPHRRRGALFPAETDAAAPPQRRVRVEHDQKVRDLRAQLEAERRAHRADGRRRRPAAPREARHDQARAEPRGEGEARLRDAQKGLRANRAASPFSKRAVKDRTATSSSYYHEDGVEAMLGLCAAKGPGPARAPARPSGGPSSGSRASSRGCAGPACDCPRASRGWSRPAGARTARVDGRRAGALSHSSSSRNVTSPSWPSDAERRSRLSCSGRSGRERIASTTSGYLNVGAPPTATTLSPNFRPNRSASPPGARAESTPSPP